MSKDNIAFRFLFNVVYRIIDGQKFLSNIALDKDINAVIHEAEQRMVSIVQRYIKNIISALESESLNEKEK